MKPAPTRDVFHEADLVALRAHFAVEFGDAEAAEEIAERRARRDAEGEEVVAGEVGAFVAGFREVVEKAAADG